jgi:sulfatase modifying factor 1
MMIKFILSLSILVMTSSVYAQLVVYPLVQIGGPGNAADSNGFGAVSYDFQIGKYEVTVSNYTAFLNAVAKEDTYGLWVNAMQASSSIAGITRSGSSGNYVYAAMTNSSGTNSYSSNGAPPFKSSLGQDSSNFPITFVSWFNAARFANWMANGQPSGLQNSVTTENGAYPINASTTSGPAPIKNTINPNTGSAPTFYIPSENEWYKAAYFDQVLNNGAGGYWRFATKSNTAPGNIVPGSAYSSTQPTSNQANYIYGSDYLYCVTQAAAIDTTQYYLSPVGTFVDVMSPWGAYDMNGSVWELNTLTGAGSINVGMRGGAWTSLASYLAVSYYLGAAPYTTASNVGFRLAAPMAIQ